jgi:hypothetical protein
VLTAFLTVCIHDLHRRGLIEAVAVDDEDSCLGEERGEELAPRVLAPAGRGDVEVIDFGSSSTRVRSAVGATTAVA